MSVPIPMQSEDDNMEEAANLIRMCKSMNPREHAGERSQTDQ